MGWGCGRRSCDERDWGWNLKGLRSEGLGVGQRFNHHYYDIPVKVIGSILTRRKGRALSDNQTRGRGRDGQHSPTIRRRGREGQHSATVGRRGREGQYSATVRGKRREGQHSVTVKGRGRKRQHSATVRGMGREGQHSAKITGRGREGQAQGNHSFMKLISGLDFKKVCVTIEKVQ